MASRTRLRRLLTATAGLAVAAAMLAVAAWVFLLADGVGVESVQTAGDVTDTTSPSELDSLRRFLSNKQLWIVVGFTAIGFTCLFYGRAIWNWITSPEGALKDELAKSLASQLRWRSTHRYFLGSLFIGLSILTLGGGLYFTVFLAPELAAQEAALEDSRLGDLDTRVGVKRNEITNLEREILSEWQTVSRESQIELLWFESAEGLQSSNGVWRTYASRDFTRALAVTNDESLARSEDGLKTWRPVEGIPQDQDVWDMIVSEDLDRALALTYDGLLYGSEGDLARWSEIESTGLPAEEDFAFTRMNGGTSRALVATYDGRLYLSDEDFRRWEPVASPNTERIPRASTLFTSPDFTRGLALTDQNRLIVARGGLQNWMPIEPVTFEVRELHVTADFSFALVLTQDGRLMASSGDFLDWRPVVQNVPHRGINALRPNQDLSAALAVARDGRIWRWQREPSNWSSIERFAREERASTLYSVSQDLNSALVGTRRGTLLFGANRLTEWREIDAFRPGERVRSVTASEDLSRALVRTNQGRILLGWERLSNWRPIVGIPLDDNFDPPRASEDFSQAYLVSGAGAMYVSRTYPKILEMKPETPDQVAALFGSDETPSLLPNLVQSAFAPTMNRLTDELTQAREELETANTSIDAIKSLQERITGLGPIVTRALAIAITLLIVQIFVRLYQYNVKLAAFYDARADALLLAPSLGKLKHEMRYNELVDALSPDGVDFGKAPKTMVDQAAELAKVMVEKRPGGTV